MNYSGEEIERLFEIEELINLDDIEKQLVDYKNKKIILFGAGTAGKYLCEKISDRYYIECFLDNNEKIWGNLIGGVEVKNPAMLENCSEDDYVVAVISKHRKVICKQLEEYNFHDVTGYIDLYSEFSGYFLLRKFVDSTKKYIGFLNQLPYDLVKEQKDHSSHIGVVCIVSVWTCQVWYAITIYLLLLYSGYNATLIIDDMQGVDDILYFKNLTKIISLYMEYVISYLKDKYANLDIRYVKASTEAELEPEDLQEVDRLSKINATWLNSRPYELSDYNMQEKQEMFSCILKDNMKYIKGFFAENTFDTINVISALHKTRGLYMWEGRRHGFRVSSYDGTSGDNLTLFSTDYPCSYHYDIPKAITRKNFDVDYWLEKAWDSFNFRMHATKDDGGYNFQNSLLSDYLKKDYDVIIPLNINCDAAALGIDKVFKDEYEWLMETINYIVENTDATILVREHPALLSKVWEGCELVRYNQIIKSIYDSKRVYFCEFNEPVNSYRVIEKAKLVLPYASTIGVESVMLGIPIITHTNVYYSKLGFSNAVSSKEEYYTKIHEALNGELQVSSEMKNEAGLAYIGLMSMIYYTEFREVDDVWMKYPLEDLYNATGVREILDVIAENKELTFRSKEI